MKEALTFNDVNIVPGFSYIESRKDVDLSSMGMALPIISANMDTITNSVLARAMLDNGAQACLHRFCTIEENVQTFLDSCSTKISDKTKPMVSIGLGDKELDRASALLHANAEIFVIDVANGAQFSVAKQALKLKEIIKNNGSIIVGNFASAKSVKDFLYYFNELEALKMGVGPGSSCSTRVKTGVGVPQFTAIQEIVNVLKNTGIKTIADGGMKTSGDVAKALGIGADAVMSGSFFAGTDESPGEVIYIHKGVQIPEGATLDPKCYFDQIGPKPFKKYRGSASKESYEAQGKVGKHRTSEGESFMVPYKGPVANVLQDIEGGLRSAFTYVGALNLKEFHDKVEFVRVTHAGHVEGTPHGKSNL